MFGKLSFSVILVICMLQGVRTANNCKVSNEVVKNPNLKCVPPLIEAEASPSTVCILPCKSNPIKFKFRCNRNGQWDAEPNGQLCDDLKICENPWLTWTQWTWKCSLGHQQGSTCLGTCSTNPNVQAKMVCKSNGMWVSDTDLDNPDRCKMKYLLMVTTGKMSNGTLLDSTEVIDLEDSSSTCQPLPNFVYPVYSAVGGLLNGSPFICNGNDDFDKCCSLTNSNVEISVGLRLFAASIMVNDTLWITGGSAPQQAGSEMKSSILVLPNGETKPGPDLPIPVKDHCLVGINENEYFLIGGYPEGNRTFKYNFAEGSWTTGPNLLKHRQDHACGLFTDDGRRKIIVSGGLSNAPPPYLPTSEILDFQAENANFEYGPSLLSALYGHSMVFNDEDAFIIGGTDPLGRTQSSIYKLGKENWTKIEQELNTAREGMVAMLIPSSLTNCIKSRK